MRMMVALLALTGLAAGLVGVFAVSQLSESAGAAPAATQVREQNLDANGFIRVHEQGTSNVNVSNSSLPVSGTVSVGNLPVDGQGNLRVTSQTPNNKSYVLYEGPIGANELVTTPAVDVQGCSDFTLFILNAGERLPNGNQPKVEGRLHVSADGVDDYGILSPLAPPIEVVSPDQRINTAIRSSTDNVTGLGVFNNAFTPFTFASIQAPSGLPARDIKVTLHCVT